MTPAPRVAVVTGASSGIGRAVAHQLAAAGDHLVLVARGRSSLEETAAECRMRGAESTLVLAFDVADDDAVRRGMETVLESHPHIDVVVHCAGVVAYGRTEEIAPEVFAGVLRTNLEGTVNLARHIVPLMRARDSGSFVQIGSVIGHMAVPWMSPYAVSKWGVRALIRQLQVENRDKRGFHISYVSPGGVDTPIYLQAANGMGHPGRPPLPVVSPEHVASVVRRRLERPRDRTQVPWTNDLIRFGFNTMPRLFDLLVTPLFRVAATDLTMDIAASAGNVLTSQPAGNRLHGRQGNAVVGIGRNIVKNATRHLRGTKDG